MNSKTLITLLPRFSCCTVQASKDHACGILRARTREALAHTLCVCVCARVVWCGVVCVCVCDVACHVAPFCNSNPAPSCLSALHCPKSVFPRCIVPQSIFPRCIVPQSVFLRCIVLKSVSALHCPKVHLSVLHCPKAFLRSAMSQTSLSAIFRQTKTRSPELPPKLWETTSTTQ